MSTDGDEWATLTLNPHSSGATANPECPDCGQAIKAVEGQHERRFVCGCDDLREFRFSTKGLTTVQVATAFDNTHADRILPDSDDLSRGPAIPPQNSDDTQPEQPDGENDDCPLCGQEYDHKHEKNTVGNTPAFRSDARVCSQEKIGTGRRYFVHLPGDSDE